MVDISGSLSSRASPATPVHFRHSLTVGTSGDPKILFHVIYCTMVAAILKILNLKSSDIRSFLGSVAVIEDLAHTVAFKPGM